MESKHVTTLALILGALALVITLSSLMALQYAKLAKTFAGVPKEQSMNVSQAAPKIVSVVQGSAIVMGELDENGVVTRPIYTSSLLDSAADFGVFALPQDRYAGKIFVQSVQDAGTTTLKIYPLNVATGKLEPSLVNMPFDSYSLSDNDEVLTIVKNDHVTIFDLVTGTTVE